MSSISLLSLRHVRLTITTIKDTSESDRRQCAPKRDATIPGPTLLDKHIADLAGPVRPDGSDKFFGFENVR